MEQRSTRRRALKGIAASTALPTLAGCASIGRPADDPAETAEPTDWLEETDLAVYVEGLDVAPETTAGTVAGADLAVFGAGTAPSHEAVVDAVDAGTAVAVAGERAGRTLVGALRDRPPGDAAKTPDRPPLAGADVAYSFGYELPATPADGLSLAYPADDGVLELHARVARYGSDRRALNATVGQYRAAAARRRATAVASDGSGADWRRRGRVSVTAGRCPGGRVERVVDCYTLPDDEFVFWRFRDEMTPGVAPGSRCEGEQAGRNGRSLRRMTYGGAHGGDVHWFGPTTTTGDAASVALTAVRDPWTYEVPGVTVLATENHTENAIRWEHDVGDDSPVTGETFVSRPGVVVRYPATTGVATHDWEVAFEFVDDGGGTPATVEATGAGAWQVD